MSAISPQARTNLELILNVVKEGTLIANFFIKTNKAGGNASISLFVFGS